MSDEDPIKILQVRFAKGEISAEQYEQMLSFLIRDVSSFKQTEKKEKPDIIETPVEQETTPTLEPEKPEFADDAEAEEIAVIEPDSTLTEPERTTVKEIATAIANAEEPVSSDIESLGIEVTEETETGESEEVPAGEEDFAAGTVLDTSISDEQIEAIEISEEIPEEVTEKKESAERFLSQEDLGNVCYVTAVNLVQAGEFEKAYPFIEKSLTIQPELTLSWLYKGFIHHNRKEYEEAITCFDKVLAKDPFQIRAWLFKGYSLFHLHQDDKALECFDRVIKEDR